MMSIFHFLLKIQNYPIAEANRNLVLFKERINALGLAAYQKAQRENILQWHLQNTPAFTQFQQKKITDWNEVKPLHKKDYQSGLRTWISQPFQNKRNYVGSTSGSSGHPFWFAKDKYCHALTWASADQFYRTIGVADAELQARFYGIPLSGISRVKELTKDLIMHRRRFPVFDLSEPAFDAFLVEFQKRSFGYLYGYTSALVEFARHCQKRNLVLHELCPSLKACIYTSESIGPGEQEFMTKAFGIPVYAEYGSSETGIIAFQNENGELEVDGSLIYLEEYMLPNGSPTTLVTSLYNKAFPIIRYDIGDIVKLEVYQAKTIIRQIEGRTNDLIHLPDGRLAAGLTFYYISRSILEKSGVLKEFIIRQKEFSHFVFEIVSERKLNTKEEELIRNETAKYLMPGLAISFSYVESIPRLKNGKIKHFISELT